MGISRSYASVLYSDPDGEGYRRRRLSYRGTCEICGVPTDGSNGPAKAPKRCIHHNIGAEMNRARRGTGPVARDLCILIGDGIDRYIDLVNALDTYKGYLSQHLDRMLKRELIERVSRGRYRLTAKGQALADSAL